MERNKILYIKNMVCNRCIKVINDELGKIGVNCSKISLGEVELKEVPTQSQIENINFVLRQNGFELIEDKKVKIVEQIKNLIIKIIHSPNYLLTTNQKFSELIEKELGLDYNYLSGLFSLQESITIEQFIILQKIEKAKELLKYGELSLSEISYQLGYSSVQHLSNQFKKVTGFTASEFKKITDNMRKSIDSLN